MDTTEKKMTVEELLKPRWKVIADYPANQREVGEIIDGLPNQWDNQELERQMNLYPHLFKKLEWWDERSVDDMPQYVKMNPTFDIGYEAGIFYQVKEWGVFSGDDDSINGDRYALLDVIRSKENVEQKFNIAHLLPATESEYLSQQKHS